MPLYAFNGTWNSEKTDDLATQDDETLQNTNVVRFRDAYDRGNGYYCNGVGTRIGVFGKVFGGALGAGGGPRLDAAMAHLEQREAAGDREIDIVGFSRGAALALAFANRVATRDARAHIRFLALFDVVGSFGIPINLGPIKFQEYNLGYQLDLPRHVEYCFHAMALDERRQTFRVTRVKGAYEVWFRGAHSDIGGGNGNAGLNSIALCWMLRKAAACGLPIRQQAILDAAAACRPHAAVTWPSDPYRNKFRPVAADDRVHHTVAIPCGNKDYQDPPASCVREAAEMESVAGRTALFA